MKYVVSTVQCVVCSVQCAVCSLQCAVYSVQCAVKRVALCSLQCEVSSLHCVVCSVGGQDSRASSNHGFTKDQQLLCVLYQLCCISFFFFTGGILRMAPWATVQWIFLPVRFWLYSSICSPLCWAYGTQFPI